MRDERTSRDTKTSEEKKKIPEGNNNIYITKQNASLTSPRPTGIRATKTPSYQKNIEKQVSPSMLSKNS